MTIMLRKVKPILMCVNSVKRTIHSIGVKIVTSLGQEHVGSVLMKIQITLPEIAP